MQFFIDFCVLKSFFIKFWIQIIFDVPCYTGCFKSLVRMNFLNNSLSICLHLFLSKVTVSSKVEWWPLNCLRCHGHHRNQHQSPSNRVDVMGPINCGLCVCCTWVPIIFTARASFTGSNIFEQLYFLIKCILTNWQTDLHKNIFS